jgi:hypothetical protein
MEHSSTKPLLSLLRSSRRQVSIRLGRPIYWFDSREGLTSFQAITDELRMHPEPLGAEPWSNHWHQMLIDDLAYCGVRLREAAESGQGFRLQVVP